MIGRVFIYLGDVFPRSMLVGVVDRLIVLSN